MGLTPAGTAQLYPPAPVLSGCFRLDIALIPEIKNYGKS